MEAYYDVINKVKFNIALKEGVTVPGEEVRT